jgi:23S rRNA (pseudouridine1915-N3)-methyltransferase
MKLGLLWVAGAREPYAEVAAEKLVSQIRHFLAFNEMPLKARTLARGDSAEKRLIESAKILESIKTSDFVILLSESGKLGKSSRQFSEWLVRALESGRQRVLFIIGGPYGVDKSVETRADLILSLSPLTFNHHIARIVALEQIYRGLSIWKNRPYHND